MYPLDNWIETEQGISVPTSEHAYQAAKFKQPNIHRIIAGARSQEENKTVYADGVVSKELASIFVEQGFIRPDFEIAKRGIMLAVVTMKFDRNPDLAEMLIATDDEMIVEGNNWGDRYWGVDPIGSDNGENHLGRILMKVRRDLQNNLVQ